MKAIRPSKNKAQWPRKTTKTIECRKRDLVIRITNWLDDRDEPAYDVETYIGGVYDWNESQVFTVRESTRAEAKKAAIVFAQEQIEKLL